MAEAITRAGTEDQEHALCMIDLDRFKIANDTCGHYAGDILLRQLTNLLQDTLRGIDRLARLGGDEFGILLVGCPIGTAVALTERLCEAVGRFRFTWEQHTFTVGVSARVAAITAQTRTMDDVMRAADAACYLAKDKGRGRVHRYLPDDGELAREEGRSRWAGRLLEAVREDRLELYQQTIAPIGPDRTTASSANCCCACGTTTAPSCRPRRSCPRRSVST